MARCAAHCLAVATAMACGMLTKPASAQCANLPPGTTNVSFASMYMGGNWPLVVYLPPDYTTSGRRYPVVYWFHGRGDNQCTQLPLANNIQSAIESGAAAPMIYVFLNGGAQCNFDDTSCPGMKTESYVMKELIPYVDAHYRTIPAPEAKALEGFSMGAEAVLRYFYAYTDQFCDAMAYAPLAQGTVPQAAQALIKARGEVVMRIAVGTADAQHYGPCQTYDKMLTSLMIPHEYETVPGVAHNPFNLWGAMGGMVGQRGLALHTRCFASLQADADAGLQGDGGSSDGGGDASPPADASDAEGETGESDAAAPVGPAVDGESEAAAEDGGAPSLADGTTGAGGGSTQGAAPGPSNAAGTPTSGCTCAFSPREAPIDQWASAGVSLLLLGRRRSRRIAAARVPSGTPLRIAARR